MEGQTVVTSDDKNLGTVVGERGDCVVVESGHVFKAQHAIPREFLHEHDGVLRATVAKETVTGSPKVDLEQWDESEVLEHYGLVDNSVAYPDPDGLENAETAGARAGVTPAPAARMGAIGGAEDPALDVPPGLGRPHNPIDPSDPGGAPRHTGDGRSDE